MCGVWGAWWDVCGVGSMCDVVRVVCYGVVYGVCILCGWGVRRMARAVCVYNMCESTCGVWCVLCGKGCVLGV